MYRLQPEDYFNFDLDNYNVQLLLRTSIQTCNSIIIVRVHDSCPVGNLPPY
jgi:hypothetical protein